MSTQILPAVYDTRSAPGRVLALLDHVVVAALLASVAVMVGVVSAQVALRYGFNRVDRLGRRSLASGLYLEHVPGRSARRTPGRAHRHRDRGAEAAGCSRQDLLRRGAAAISAAMMAAIAWASLGVAREQWDELMSTLDWSVGWFIVPVGVGALLSALHLARHCGLRPARPGRGRCRMSAGVVVGFMLLALFGFPIAFAMGVASLTALWISGVDFSIVPQRMMHAVNSFPLMSIPFFMLAGELMIKAGIVERLISLANSVVGRVRGGMAHVTMLSGAGLADRFGALRCPTQAHSRPSWCPRSPRSTTRASRPHWWPPRPISARSFRPAAR